MSLNGRAARRALAPDRAGSVSPTAAEFGHVRSRMSTAGQAGIPKPPGMVPIDRLAQIAPACRISRTRLVDAGRIITAGGIASGMETG